MPTFEAGALSEGQPQGPTGNKPDDVILQMAPHTKAKHSILKEYMNGWLAIIGQTSGRLVYLDGFAGSDHYDDGSHGSPSIVIDCARNHFLKDKIKSEMVFIFTEIDAGRYNHLMERLKEQYGDFDPTAETFGKLPKTYKFMIRNGDFNKVADEILSGLEKEGLSLAPTLAFVDPFGYTLDLDLLARILRFRRCELLVTYMSGFIDRFASEEKHRQSILNTLKISEEELAKTASIPDRETRELTWLRYLNDAIVGKAKSLMANSLQPIHKLYFRMLDRSNNTLYYLAYFTKGEKGIEVMKRAMSKAGTAWNYRFSDHDFDPNQASILDYTSEKPWIKEQAEAIYNRYRGRKMPVFMVKKWVLTSTMWLPRSESLEILERDGRAKYISGRKRSFTYPDSTWLEFAP